MAARAYTPTGSSTTNGVLYYAADCPVCAIPVRGQSAASVSDAIKACIGLHGRGVPLSICKQCHCPMGDRATHRTSYWHQLARQQGAPAAAAAGAATGAASDASAAAAAGLFDADYADYGLFDDYGDGPNALTGGDDSEGPAGASSSDSAGAAAAALLEGGGDNDSDDDSDAGPAHEPFPLKEQTLPEQLEALGVSRAQVEFTRLVMEENLSESCVTKLLTFFHEHASACEKLPKTGEKLLRDGRRLQKKLSVMREFCAPEYHDIPIDAGSLSALQSECAPKQLHDNKPRAIMLDVPKQLQSLLLDHSLVADPERPFVWRWAASGGDDAREYTDLHDSSRWKEEQDRLGCNGEPDGKTLLAVVAFSDATRIMTIGGYVYHPVFLTLGNFPGKLRKSFAASRLVAFVPSFESLKKSPSAAFKAAAQVVTSSVFSMVERAVSDLENGGDGVRLRVALSSPLRSEAVTRTFMPTLLLMLGDWPEVKVICGLYQGAQSNFPCSMCYVPRSSLAQPVTPAELAAFGRRMPGVARAVRALSKKASRSDGDGGGDDEEEGDGDDAVGDDTDDENVTGAPAASDGAGAGASSSSSSATAAKRARVTNSNSSSSSSSSSSSAALAGVPPSLSRADHPHALSQYDVDNPMWDMRTANVQGIFGNCIAGPFHLFAQGIVKETISSTMDVVHASDAGKRGSPHFSALNARFRIMSRTTDGVHAERVFHEGVNEEQVGYQGKDYIAMLFQLHVAIGNDGAVIPDVSRRRKVIDAVCRLQDVTARVYTRTAWTEADLQALASDITALVTSLRAAFEGVASRDRKRSSDLADPDVRWRRPKVHNLAHLPELIRMLGAPGLWCEAYGEGLHRMVKELHVRSNGVNPELSVANRIQLGDAFNYLVEQLDAHDAATAAAAVLAANSAAVPAAGGDDAASVDSDDGGDDAGGAYLVALWTQDSPSYVRAGGYAFRCLFVPGQAAVVRRLVGMRHSGRGSDFPPVTVNLAKSFVGRVVAGALLLAETHRPPGSTLGGLIDGVGLAALPEPPEGPRPIAQCETILRARVIELRWYETLKVREQLDCCMTS